VTCAGRSTRCRKTTTTTTFDGTQGVTTEIMGRADAVPVHRDRRRRADAQPRLPDLGPSSPPARPQVTTYTINPKATWSDGTPITWRDFEAQWKATNGTDPAFRIASKTGTEDIASVVRGVDDRQAVVTYGPPVRGVGRNQFSPLYPASTNTDPATFNTGWLNRIPTTAGAVPAGLDRPHREDPHGAARPPPGGGRAGQVGPDPVPGLRTCRAGPDALANNEIDFYKIGSSVDLLKRAPGDPPGVAIRQSPEAVLQPHHVQRGAGRDPVRRAGCARPLRRGSTGAPSPGG